MTIVPNLRYQKCCVCKKALQNKNKAKNVCRVGATTIERIRMFLIHKIYN
jgi:hypothetical protein